MEDNVIYFTKKIKSNVLRIRSEVANASKKKQHEPQSNCLKKAMNREREYHIHKDIYTYIFFHTLIYIIYKHREDRGKSNF